jgi:uncharacterized membrane protein
LSQNNRIDKAIADFIVIPAIVLIGIYVAASLVDAMLQLNNQTFRILFTAVGGVPALAYYFKRKMAEL